MTRVVGHRGAAGIAPENTLESLEVALDCGVDGVEFDVWLTQDNVPMLMHMSLHHITGEFKFLPQLTRHQVADLGEQEGFHVPTLHEALNLLEGEDVELFIEFKQPDVVTHTVDAVQDRDMLDRTVFLSFIQRCLEEIEPDTATTGLLSIMVTDFTISRAHAVDATYLVSNNFTTFGTTMDRIRAHGLEPGVWKVNTELAIRRVLTLDPAFLITDRPDLVPDEPDSITYDNIFHELLH